MQERPPCLFGSRPIKTSNVVLYAVFLFISKWPTRYYFRNILATIPPNKIFRTLRRAYLNLSFTGSYKKENIFSFCVLSIRIKGLRGEWPSGPTSSISFTEVKHGCRGPMPGCGMHSRPKLSEKARYNSLLKIK